MTLYKSRYACNRIKMNLDLLEYTIAKSAKINKNHYNLPKNTYNMDLDGRAYSKIFGGRLL